MLDTKRIHFEYDFTEEELQHIKNNLQPNQTIQDYLVAMITNDQINVDEVAKMLQMTKGSVYRLTSLHLIPFFKPGKYLIFSRAAIRAYIDRRRFLSKEDMRNEAARIVAR